MDSLQKSSVDVNKNLRFADQRDVIQNTSRLGCSSVVPNFAMKISMPETPWTFESAAMRPIPVEQSTWTTSQAPGTTVDTIKLPTDIWNTTNSYFEQILRVISYFRCDLKLRIQLNSTRFHEGLLLAYFIPLQLRAVASNAFTTDFGQHLYNCVLFPHAYIDASQATDAEILIPFQHIQTFLDLTNDTTLGSSGQDIQKQFMGNVYFDVLSQLRVAGTTNTTVNFTTWVQPVNPKLHVVVADHGLPVAQGLEGALSEIPAVAQHVLSGISNVAEGNIQGAISDGQAVYEGVKTVIDNLDNPIDPFKPACVISAGGEMASGDGRDCSIRLSLGSASVTKHPEEILCEPNKELLISNLCRLPSILDVLDGGWTTSNAVGTSLATYYVHPCNTRITAGSNYGTPSGTPSVPRHKRSYVDPTNLSALASRFAFWSGSIVFGIRVVSTTFHTGRLRIVFFPNSNTPDIYSQSLSYPLIVFDIAEEKYIRFTIPYVSPTPWKRTPNYCNYVTAPNSARFFLGCISIFVQNPLVAPGTVATSVSLVIEISGGPDFRVAVPAAPYSISDNTLTFTQDFFFRSGPPGLLAERSSEEEEVPIGRRDKRGLGFPLTSSRKSPDAAHFIKPSPAVAQADEAPHSREHDRLELYKSPAPNPLISPGGPISALFGFMNGEEYDNIKDIMKRYAMMDIINPSIVAPTSDSFAYDIPVTPLYNMYTQNDSSLPTTNGGTYEICFSDNFSYFASLFAFWRGSIRYKFMTNFSKDMNAITYACHQPDYYIQLSNPNLFTNASPWYKYSDRLTYASDGFNFNYFSSYATQFENVACSPCMNVEVPYTSPYMSLPTFWYWFTPSGGSLTWIDVEAITSGTLEYGFTSAIGNPPTTPAQTQHAAYDYVSPFICVFYAAGDDFMPHWYIGPMTQTCYTGELP